MTAESHSIFTRVVLPAVLVALAAFALYAPTLGYDFVALDDEAFTYANPVVKDGISGSSLAASWTTAPENYWAPLLWTSFMLDVEWFGPGPRGHHLANVFLFALNAGLLFALMRRWTGRTGAALAVAALWALHPARVESVAWITERKDVLSGLLFLLGIGAYVESRRRARSAGVWLAWACMAAGGLVKQIMIVMPAALLLLDVWPLGRIDWSRFWRSGWRLALEKWAFWLVAAALTFPPIWFHYDRGSMLDVSVGHRLAMIPIHYLFYFHKTLWPVGLMPLQPDLPFRTGAFLAGAGILIGGTWATWRFRKEAPWGLAGWLWFVGLLFPLIGVVWAGQERLATRFLYLPHVGLCWAVVLAAEAWIRQRGWNRKWGAALCLAALVACGFQTARLLPHWRDEKAFSAAVWKYNSGHETAGLLGGDWHMTRGEWAAADAAYARGANKGNKRCFARLCWLRLWCGRAAEIDGLWDEFERASGIRLLEFTPRDVAADRQILWTVRGQILRERGDFDGAIAALGEAVKLDADPASFTVAEFLRTCYAAGRPEAGSAVAERLRAAKGIAIREWRDLLPRYLQFWQEGGRGLAFGYFEEYARRFPDDGLALNNMAWLLATAAPDGLRHARMAEWPSSALDWAERAVAQGGEDMPGAWDTLAAARANAGDFEGAIAAVERARELARQAGEWTLDAQLQARLAEYRAGQPWREPDERAKNAAKKPSP